MPETQAPANGNGKHEQTKTHNPNEPGVRSLDWDPALVSLVQQTTNSYSSRMEYFNRLMDPRRNLDAECGYPSTYSVGADFYRQLYDRDPIASRVVQLMPKECWQKTPRIFEDEDSKNVTEFERAWDNLGRQLSPERSWYEDEEGSLVWEYLRRADEVSGIGAFGVMLLGLDDGADLRDPVEGAVSDKYMRDRDGKAKKGTNNSLRLDPAKLSFPTPMPGEETLNEMVANSMTPPIEEWAEHGGVGNKHVDQTEANRHSVRPTFVRNADGERWELLRDDKLVTNEYKAQVGLTANEIGPASKVMQDAQGQDAQYMGVQLGASEYPSEKPLKEKLQLTFLRVFDEALVQIVQYEANIRNPRFSRPVMYRITFNDPREQHSGIGLPLASIYVHWTRIVHLADTGNGVSSEIFAAPRMRPVLNPLLDCRKISGAGAEGYWQSCFAGIVLSTHPQLGGEVQLDVPANKAMMENYFNGLQRFLILSGMGASTIAPSVVDPTPHADLQVKRICIQLGCPKRVFEGSERGELASSQDDSKWNDRVGSRCNTYVTPRVICPFVDRLILLGVLPEPEQYRVEWPDLDSTTKKDKATIASTLTTALQAYVTGNVEAIMTFRDYLVQVWDWDEETVDEVIKSAEKLHEKEMTMTMPPKGEPGHPATVPPPPPKVPPNPVVMGPGQTMVPHPDHPNAAAQKPFTAPTPPQPKGAKPPTKNEMMFDKEDCPKCGASMEGDPYSGECNSCGHKRGKEITDNWCNQYGGDSCKEGGEVAHEEGTKESPIHCGHDIKLAAKLLADGKHIVLNQPEQVSTLVDKLGKMLEKAIEKGEKAPKIDMCKVSVPGSNLFCQESIGVPRAQMPQMRGQAVKGSYADTKGRVNKDGKVDVTQEFIKHMYDQGIKSSSERIPASHLRASQNEIDGARVAELVGKADRGKDLLERPIFVTRDNYVLDGHHHWAADTVLGLRGGRDVSIPVVKLDVDIGRGITMANDFSRSAGIAPKTVGTSSPARSGHAITGRTSNQERIDMPQIRRRYWDDFLAYARVRTSVEYEPACDPNDLHAIQSEYDQQRIDDMPMSKLDHPILASRDGYVLDGNHRWIKAGQEGVTIPVLRIGLDKEFALDLLRAFPQSEYVENFAQGQPRDEQGRFSGEGDSEKLDQLRELGPLSARAVRLTEKVAKTNEPKHRSKAIQAHLRAVLEAKTPEDTKAHLDFVKQHQAESWRLARSPEEKSKAASQDQSKVRNAVRLLVRNAVAEGHQLLFNEAGEDEDSMISQAIAEHDDPWFETLLQVALQETQGDVQSAVKFAEQYYAANPDGGEEDDDEGDDDDPTGNSNPEGCNQYKPCGGGTVGESAAMLDKFDELSNDRENYPRETSKVVVDAVSHHSKDELKTALKSTKSMGHLVGGSKKAMLAKVYDFLDSGHRAWERIQS